MQNNQLFDILFRMYNNLNIIIKIFSAIYLSLTVIFPSVLLYWHNESWVHITRKHFHNMSRTGSTSNRHFLAKIIHLIIIFNFIKFHMSPSKVSYFLISTGRGNLIHIDIIFAAPNFGFLKQYISANNTISLKLITTLDLSYQRL